MTNSHVEAETTVRAMIAALRHRGPDDTGAILAGAAALGHTRLAIIDPAGGAQPMCLAGDRLTVVFNGEIYNYIELRDELIARGRTFRTRSDTEVVLHAFAVWGDRAFQRFNGQWALALWDDARQRLVLCRDRVGIHPLYYAESPERVMFASEVKALFAGDPALRAGLDPIGLDQTLTFWAAIAPRTVFRGISELPPGHMRVYERGAVAERAWIEHDFAPRFAGTIADAERAVRDALERATALRMLRADVPVGCYLSGGLDSSLIAALGQRAKGERFHTFSLRFADAEYDEGEYQRAMVARLGSDHLELSVSRADIAAAFPAVVRHAERPILRTAPAPMLLLSRAVRDAGIKVVLTGEGADEMLAGYDLFREARVRRFWAREPASKLRPRLLDRLYPYLARSPAAARAMAHGFFARDLDRPHAPDFAHGPRWHAARALQRLFSADLRAQLAGRDPAAELIATLPPELATWDPLARDQYVEIRTLLSGYLLSAQGDRMAMAGSVEGRFPFLDAEVVELACALPADYKLRVLDEKHVLKRVAGPLVPPAIVRRPKQPYRAPDALAFAAKGRPAWVDEVLARPAVAACGAFDPDAVERLWAKCRAAPGQLSNADNMALVGVLSTQLLHRELACFREVSS